MNEFIPLSVPNLKGNELKYVTDAIEQEWVSTAGGYVNRLEDDMKSYLGVSGAVACQSGTAGIHLALMVSGINENHEVIVPSLTFIAAVNPVRYVGASPVFMDCDDFLCMDMDKLEEFCSIECDFIHNNLINKRTGKQVKAVIVVHVFGNMADMAKALNISKKYNLMLIEDATEALGTYYCPEYSPCRCGDIPLKEGEKDLPPSLRGEARSAGGSPPDGLNKKFAGTIGDIGVYSFNGNKIITTGGGGMLVSNLPELTQKAKYLSTQAKNDEINFIHDEVGYNYRMTNVQAALGVAQLEQLEDFIKVKTANYDRYKSAIDKISGLRILPFCDSIRANYWFYSLFIEDPQKHKKDDIIEYLAKNNIQSRPVWGLINEQKPYVNCQAYKIEKTRYYFDRIVNIPCSTNLIIEQVDCIIAKIREFVGDGL